MPQFRFVKLTISKKLVARFHSPRVMPLLFLSYQTYSFKFPYGSPSFAPSPISDRRQTAERGLQVSAFRTASLSVHASAIPPSERNSGATICRIAQAGGEQRARRGKHDLRERAPFCSFQLALPSLRRPSVLPVTPAASSPLSTCPRWRAAGRRTRSTSSCWETARTPCSSTTMSTEWEAMRKL